MAHRRAQGLGTVGLLALLLGLLAACGNSGVSGSADAFDFRSTPIPPSTPTGLACTSPSFCIVLSNDLGAARPATDEQIWNGKRWSDPTPVLRGFGPMGGTLSCASPQFCAFVTAGADGTTTGPNAHSTLATTWNGTGWSPLTVLLPTNQDQHLGLSCPTDGFCMADNNSMLWRFTDGRWSAPVTAPRSPGNATGINVDGFRALSCASPSFCLATGDTFTDRWNGTAWSRGPGPGHLLVDGLVCHAPMSCTLIGGVPDATGGSSSERSTNWTGAAWSASIPLSTDVDETLECPTPKACYAITDEGRVFRLGPKGWTDLGIQYGGNFDAGILACPTLAFCAATGPAVGTGSSLLTTAG